MSATDGFTPAKIARRGAVTDPGREVHGGAVDRQQPPHVVPEPARRPIPRPPAPLHRPPRRGRRRRTPRGEMMELDNLTQARIDAGIDYTFEHDGARHVTALASYTRQGPSGPQIVARTTADLVGWSYGVFWLLDGRWVQVTDLLDHDQLSRWKADPAWPTTVRPTSDEFNEWLTDQAVGPQMVPGPHTSLRDGILALGNRSEVPS